MTEWISVKDRLPEGGKLVLVSFEVDFGFGKTVMAVDTAMLTSYGFCGGGYDNFVAAHGLCRTKVTHWMTLPEPPQEEEQNESVD